MSTDLQDVIVESTMRAFNAGVRSGIEKERNRILTIAQKITFENWKGHDLISLQDLEEYINDESN